MKIFNGDNSSWSEKVNFVDDNDVFVGYDMGQSCCEYADWYITNEVKPYSYDDDGSKSVPDVSGYNFDAAYFEEVPSPDLDDGEMVVFKLVAENKPDLFLHLFNVHNGYYGHGFEVKHGGEIVKEGYL